MTPYRRQPQKTRRVSPSLLKRINVNIAGIDCGSAEHYVAAKNKSRCGFCRRHAKQIEAIFSALSQELAERHDLRSVRELVRDKIVFIKNPDRLSILHYCRDMRAEMDDHTALQIFRANFCRAGRG